MTIDGALDVVASSCPKLIVVAGPTGSGKSAFAKELARHFSTQIISADSCAVYTGMDIGTAKPKSSRNSEMYRLVSIMPPSMTTLSPRTVRAYVDKSIRNCTTEKKVPCIVEGGSMTYIFSILFGFTEYDSMSHYLFGARETDSIAEMADLFSIQQSLSGYERHFREVQASPLRMGGYLQRSRLRDATAVFCTQLPDAELHSRMLHRLEAMFAAGLRDEARKVVSLYGWSCPGMKAIGYREWRDAMKKGKSEEWVFNRILRNTERLGRMQSFWFSVLANLVPVYNTAGNLLVGERNSTDISRTDGSGTVGGVQQPH